MRALYVTSSMPKGMSREEAMLTAQGVDGFPTYSMFVHKNRPYFP